MTKVVKKNNYSKYISKNLQNHLYFTTFAVMKIFHIISNKEWGGGEQTVLDLSRRQLADGLEVELFCLPSNFISSRFSELHIPIHFLSLKGVLDLRSAWLMAKVIKHENDCAIHAHNFKEAFTAAYARWILGRKNIPVVMCRNLTRKGKNSVLYRWLYGQLNCIVFDSQLAMDEFLSTNPAIDHNKLRVIFNSIIIPKNLEKKDIRAEFDIAEDELIILCHGRLDPEKGQNVLIEAVAQLQEESFRLVLIGRGSDEYTNSLRQLIHKHHLDGKVVLAGFRNIVMPYVAGCDIGVLPSVVREGCSLAAQEHMSQGHPIVATNNGGQREYIVNGKNGLLVPPNDPTSLANALRMLLQNKDLRQQLGAQAKADFDNHLSYEHFYAQIRTIYDDKV